jgi:hypothetical protein
MSKKFPNLEPSTGYDGYDDYLDAVTFSYTDDQETEDYDEELEVPEYEKV